MIQPDNDSTERIFPALHQISELLQDFLQKFTEIHEYIRKSAENTLPSLIDKTTLCRTLNITERTLYRDIKEYNIPVHKLGSRLYFRWEEVERCLNRGEA